MTSRNRVEISKQIETWLLYKQAVFPVSSIFDTDLDILFDELNIQYWDGGLPKIPVIWNSRMRTKAAVFKLWSNQPVRIELNPRYFENETEEHLEGLLLHEMCHLVFNDHGRRYKLELKRVGGLYRQKRFNPSHGNQLRHEYKCPNCGMTWIRKRRYGGRMLCRKCRVVIQLIRSWRE